MTALGGGGLMCLDLHAAGAAVSPRAVIITVAASILAINALVGALIIGAWVRERRLRTPAAERSGRHRDGGKRT